jgi:hypothetical protein
MSELQTELAQTLRIYGIKIKQVTSAEQYEESDPQSPKAAYFKIELTNPIKEEYRKRNKPVLADAKNPVFVIKEPESEHLNTVYDLAYTSPIRRDEKPILIQQEPNTG